MTDQRPGRKDLWYDWQAPNWAFIDQTLMRESGYRPWELDELTLSEILLYSEKHVPTLVEPDWFVWEYREAESPAAKLEVMRRMFA